VIEAALEVVHVGLEKTLAVQSAPKTDRAELWLGRKRVAREIDLHFIRIQVDVVENDDAFDRLLNDLRGPAFCAST